MPRKLPIVDPEQTAKAVQDIPKSKRSLHGEALIESAIPDVVDTSSTALPSSSTALPSSSSRSRRSRGRRSAKTSVPSELISTQASSDMPMTIDVSKSEECDDQTESTSANEIVSKEKTLASSSVCSSSQKANNTEKSLLSQRAQNHANQAKLTTVEKEKSTSTKKDKSTSTKNDKSNATKSDKSVSSKSGKSSAATVSVSIKNAKHSDSKSIESSVGEKNSKSTSIGTINKLDKHDTAKSAPVPDVSSLEEMNDEVETFLIEEANDSGSNNTNDDIKEAADSAGSAQMTDAAETDESLRFTENKPVREKKLTVLATVSDHDTKHFKKVIQDYCFKQRHKVMRGFKNKIKDQQKALEKGKVISKPIDEERVHHDIRILVHLSDIILAECAWQHYVYKTNLPITAELYASQSSSDAHLPHVSISDFDVFSKNPIFVLLS